MHLPECISPAPPTDRSAAWLYAPLLCIALLAVQPLGAQVRVDVTLSAPDIAARHAGTCRWAVTRLKETADPDNPDQLLRVADTVVVHAVGGDGQTSTPAGAALTVQVGTSGTRYLMPATDSVRSFPVGLREIAARTVTVGAESGGRALCVATPAPLVSAARNIGVTHHDLFAGGEVSTALRTGAETGAATGNLGLHSYLYRSESAPFRFPFGFLRGGSPIARALNIIGYRVDVEELRAAVTVAGQGDTLFSPGVGRDFAQAVLAPLTAPRGNLSSVNVMYSPQQRYGSTRTALRGLRVAGGATRSAWQGIVRQTVRVPLADTAARDTLAKNVTLFTADARWRWVFINHTSDDDGNVFSFAMDGGVTYRGIAGDITAKNAQNDSLLVATLGTTRRSFWGPVVGLFLTLRQVSAFAELQKLGAGRNSASRVESLEGWQPLIGFRFEAPIFTVQGR